MALEETPHVISIYVVKERPKLFRGMLFFQDKQAFCIAAGSSAYAHFGSGAAAFKAIMACASSIQHQVAVAVAVAADSFHSKPLQMTPGVASKANLCHFQRRQRKQKRGRRRRRRRRLQKRGHWGRRRGK